MREFRKHLTICSVFYTGLLPILRADPAPEDCLYHLERELKTGAVKINFLTLQEKYGEYINDMNRTKLERET